MNKHLELLYNDSGLLSGAADDVATSQLQATQFDAKLRLLPALSFTCSPRISVS